MNRHILKFFTVAMACLALSSQQVANAQITFRTVIMTGQSPSTQAGGVSIGRNNGGVAFTHPVLNSEGRVAFGANFLQNVAGVTRYNDTSIWSEGTGTLEMIAREGGTYSGMPSGFQFGNLNYSSPLIIPYDGVSNYFLPTNYALNDNGELIFTATIVEIPQVVPLPYVPAIWSNTHASPRLIANAEGLPPGFPTGNRFQSFFDTNQSSPRIMTTVNKLGHTAFTAVMDGPDVGGDVDPQGGMGVWSDRSGSLAPVAITGSVAPGAAALPNEPLTNLFAWFGNVVINSNDQVAFKGTLNAKLYDPKRQGIWSERNGTLGLVAMTGQSVPSKPLTSFSNNFGDPSINSTGATVFSAALRDGSNGVWSDRNGGLTAIALSGIAAPGTIASATFLSFFDPVISNNGTIGFYATLAGAGVTSTSDTGLWIDRSGSLALLAREGDQAPQTPVGATFGDFNSISFNPVLNSFGRVAFYSNLRTGTGGVTSSNDYGLWAEDRDGILRLVVREGQLFEVSPGTFRTITDIGFTTGSGGDDGRGRSFNDNYTLTFRLTFQGGEEGVFTATLVPEPSTWAMILCGLIGIGSIAYRKNKRLPVSTSC